MTTPATLFTPASVTSASLVAWLPNTAFYQDDTTPASLLGDQVTLWKDAGPGGNDAAANLPAGYCPAFLNGYNCISSTIGQYFTIPAGVYAPFSAYLVVRVHAQSYSVRQTFFGGIGTGVEFGVKSGFFGFMDTPSTISATDDAYLLSAVFDFSRPSLSVNKIPPAGFTGPGGNLGSMSGGIFPHQIFPAVIFPGAVFPPALAGVVAVNVSVGVFDDNLSSCLVYLAEVVVYSNVLSADDHGQVTDYLMNRYA
jgi:hypothetical protein